jgi:hypothetical protein
VALLGVANNSDHNRAVATDESAAATVAVNASNNNRADATMGGIAVLGAANGSSGSLADATNGGIALVGTFVNSTADAEADNSDAIAGAAFSSSANSTTPIPTCSGTGLAGAMRSDGHFCLDVGGTTISG